MTPPAPDRRFLVIFNPAASRGSAARHRTEIETAFRAAGAECTLVPTRARGHAVEIAAEAAGRDWAGIVAVGGDGIVHEVVNGLLGSGMERPPPLGIIPVGSGNDFVKMLGVAPHRPAGSVARLLEAETRWVDVGRVRHHVSGNGPVGEWYFTNGVGVGFDAQVAVHARGIQRLRGVAIYAWAVVKTLRHLRAPVIQVTIDGEEIADRPLILTTISNGPCHGGNFWLCPGARIDDGQLDVLIADARKLPALLLLLPRVLLGRHLDQVGVELHRGRRVSIRSQERLPIHADGEIVADWVTELDIEVLPGRLAVLA